MSDIEKKLHNAENLGDALYGIFPDENADPVEEVRKVRRRYNEDDGGC